MSLFRAPVSHHIPGRNDLDLCVWDFGGDGSPVLFSHCTGTLARVWDGVVGALDDRFRILAIDTRGHGDSETPPTRDEYAWELSGHDLLAVADHFGLGDSIDAVGHSAGGAHVAYAEHIRPGSIGRAVLIDPIIGPREHFQGSHPLAEKVRYRINEFESVAAARERLCAKPPMSRWCDTAVVAYLAHAFHTDADGSCSLKCPGDREAWFYELGGACEVFETLEDLSCQTCLITGSESYVQPLVAVQQEKLPNSKMEIVPETGHFIPQEKPAAMAEIIHSSFPS
jgi:pimeloyl-ACP methyl ester carboxylesterase